MRSLTRAFTLMTFVGLCPLAGNAAPPPDAESEAAVSLARETLARRMRTDPAEYELLAVTPSLVRLSGSAPRCEPPATEGEGSSAEGWRVRLRHEEDTYDLVVAEGMARMCNIQSGAQPVSEHGTIERGLLPLADEAREDLARRLSIQTESVEVMEAVSVVWRDSSAGCPRKGMAYAQVLTPGVRIRLDVGGRPYLYHGRKGESPFLCPRPSAAKPLPSATS